MDELTKQLPELLTEENGHPSTFKVGEDGCLPPLGKDSHNCEPSNSVDVQLTSQPPGTVLRQEIVKCNRLLERCKTSLANLKNAVQGLAVMSQVGVAFDIHTNVRDAVMTSG